MYMHVHACAVTARMIFLTRDADEELLTAYLESKHPAIARLLPSDTTASDLFRKVERKDDLSIYEPVGVRGPPSLHPLPSRRSVANKLEPQRVRSRLRGPQNHSNLDPQRVEGQFVTAF